MKLNLSRSKYKELIPAEKKSVKTSLKEIHDIISDHSRYYIFFDLETLGMHPNSETDQIIEIAASVSHGFDTKETISTFYRKIKLSSASEMILDSNNVLRDVWIKRNSKNNESITPEKILKMTDYNNNLGDLVDEQTAICEFLNFIRRFDNPILVAHNSGYDVKFLATRLFRFGYDLDGCDVIDTLKISRYFFIPLLMVRKDYEIERKIYEKLLYKNASRISLSSKLGNIANSLGINSTNWHTANGDVEMLREVMYFICDFLGNNLDIDISKFQKRNVGSKLKNLSYNKK